MEVCLGMLMMRPKDFWELSMVELYAAVRGFKQFHASTKEEPLHKEELDELMELYPDE